MLQAFALLVVSISFFSVVSIQGQLAAVGGSGQQKDKSQCEAENRESEQLCGQQQNKGKMVAQKVTVVDDKDVGDDRAGAAKEESRQTQCGPGGKPIEKRYAFNITRHSDSQSIATHKDCVTKAEAKKIGGGAFEQCVAQCKDRGVGIFEASDFGQAAQAAGSVSGVPGQCGQSKNGKYIGVCGSDEVKNDGKTPRERYNEVRNDEEYKKLLKDVEEKTKASQSDPRLRDAMSQPRDGQFPLANSESEYKQRLDKAERAGSELGAAEKARGDYLKERNAYPIVHDSFETRVTEDDYKRAGPANQAFMRGRYCTSSPDVGYSFCK